MILRRHKEFIIEGASSFDKIIASIMYYALRNY
jgi:hypothetical protein